MSKVTTKELFERIVAHKKQMSTITAAATDVVASECVDLFPCMTYSGELIKNGTRIKWQGKLKRAAVDLWDREDNDPDNAPALWENVAYYKGHRIIPETITATLAFSAGEIGYWSKDDTFYAAKADGTVWTPEGHPAAWEVAEI